MWIKGLGGEDNDDADAFHRGIAPIAKLLYAVASRLAEVAPRKVAPLLLAWRTSETAIDLRLWAALGSGRDVVPLDVAEFWRDSITRGSGISICTRKLRCCVRGGTANWPLRYAGTSRSGFGTARRGSTGRGARTRNGWNGRSASTGRRGNCSGSPCVAACCRRASERGCRSAWFGSASWRRWTPREGFLGGTRIVERPTVEADASFGELAGEVRLRALQRMLADPEDSAKGSSGRAWLGQRDNLSTVVVEIAGTAGGAVEYSRLLVWVLRIHGPTGEAARDGGGGGGHAGRAGGIAGAGSRGHGRGASPNGWADGAT